MEKFTNDQLEKILQAQKKMIEKFRAVPESGTKVIFLDKEFVVHKNVFWPFHDTETLLAGCVINPGETVLDVCTGCGVIAIFASYKGASSVVATDINPNAVKSAKENVNFHGFSNIIDVRFSDMFSAIKEQEKFDLITANLPFINRIARDLAEACVWDTNLETHKKFFSGFENHLKDGGRIYFCQSNVGAIDEMKKMAEKSGLRIRLTRKREMMDYCKKVFYTFELTRN